MPKTQEDQLQDTGRTVLIVDDEPDVRKVVRMTLEKTGYEVLEAEDGEKAIAEIKSGENPMLLSLIITDIRMPELDGREFFELLKATHPQLTHRIVFITGDYLNAGTENFVKETGIPFICKPFSRQELLDVANRVLAPS